MKSKVYFLPWRKIDYFQFWLEKTDIKNVLKERDFTAIKIHFGEEGNRGFIEPKLAKNVASIIKSKGANPYLTDANTIYMGSRSDAVHHNLVADKHGFNIGNCSCPVIIADGLRGNDGRDIEVNLKHFKKVNIGSALANSDSIIFMSHFKGHELSGFGGVIKNAGMGCATRKGKYQMHDSLLPKVNTDKCTACEKCIQWCGGNALYIKENKINIDKEKCIGCCECILSCPNRVFDIPWDENASNVQEKIVEYMFGVLKNKRSYSINFLNHITKFCDCYPTRENPLIDDIGVLASGDPVALDRASADMVNKVYGGDFFKFIFPNIDWKVQLNYAEKLGLGKQSYELIEE